MGESTSLSDREISDTALLYGVEDRFHEKLLGGNENTSILVESGNDKYVMTVLERRDSSSATAYAAFLRSLGSNGLPVPSLMELRRGGFVALVRGRPVLLAEFIDGAHHRQLSAGLVAEVGAALGNLHASSIVCPFPAYIRLGESELETIESFSDRSFSTWLIDMYERVASVIDWRAAHVPTHGDPFPENVIAVPDGGIVMIDWDDCAQDLPLVDLGMAMLGLCFEGDRLCRERLTSLLAGYRRACPIPIDPAEFLHVTIYVSLFTGYHRFLRNLGGTAPARDYQAIRRRVDSMMCDWDRMELG